MRLIMVKFINTEFFIHFNQVHYPVHIPVDHPVPVHVPKPVPVHIEKPVPVHVYKVRKSSFNEFIQIHFVYLFPNFELFIFNFLSSQKVPVPVHVSLDLFIIFILADSIMNYV